MDNPRNLTIIGGVWTTNRTRTPNSQQERRIAPLPDHSTKGRRLRQYVRVIFAGLTAKQEWILTPVSWIF